ncbi:MAG: urease accessory protein UreF [Huintestinicola sp.]|uniref:urease accessory protein UreF n=1 Tax=Huintestinicola sp. TaxID=2981661 RepID=UPI003F0BB8B6
MNTDIKLIRLAQALDPLFPIGSFTLSNGTETYTAKDIVTDKATLSQLLSAYICTLPTGDLGFGAKAAAGEDIPLLDDLCAASRSPYELRDGSSKLCRRFLKAQMALCPTPRLTEYSRMIEKGECTGFHPIAVGLFMADIEADIREGLSLYAYSLLSAMANHAVKLVPLRQLDGQSALYAAMERIPEAVEKALSVQTDDLGISGSGFELRSMQHEKLFTRIYIS